MAISETFAVKLVNDLPESNSCGEFSPKMENASEHTFADVVELIGCFYRIKWDLSDLQGMTQSAQNRLEGMVEHFCLRATTLCSAKRGREKAKQKLLLFRIDMETSPETCPTPRREIEFLKPEPRKSDCPPPPIYQIGDEKFHLMDILFFSPFALPIKVLLTSSDWYFLGSELREKLKAHAENVVKEELMRIQQCAKFEKRIKFPSWFNKDFFVSGTVPFFVQRYGLPRPPSKEGPAYKVEGMVFSEKELLNLVGYTHWGFVVGSMIAFKRNQESRWLVHHLILLRC